MESNKYNLITILGPTASGKTSFAANLAYKLNTEIISADSRQIYKKMDIGTGKDLDDFIVSGEKIPYHLIDIADAGEKYNLFQFQHDFFDAYKNVIDKNKIPILCGGSGLYIDSIVNNYNLINVPENTNLREELEQKNLDELSLILSSLTKLHNKSDIDSKKRTIRAIEIEYFLKENPEKRNNFPNINSLNIGIKFDRQSQKKRITSRLKSRIDNGMIEEVKNLLDSGIPAETLIYYGLEYKFITLFLLNEITFDQMFEKLNIAIHQFSKRQMTWFRRMEKNGQKIWWLDGHMNLEQKNNRVIEILSK